MRKTLIAAAVAASFVAPMAFAEDAAPEVPALTANVGVISDYVFRGISQTRGGPALQAGVDYAHESGLYVGAWTSNVKWVKDGGYADGNTHEVDLYGGYKTEVAGVGLDAGVIRYTYPGSLTPGFVSPNTTEAYLGGTYGIVSLKYFYTVSDHFIGWTGGPALDKKTRGSNYTDLTVTYPVDETVNLVAHIGRQIVKDNAAASYTDWKLGATKDIGFGVLGLAVTGSDADQGVGGPYDKAAWGGHKDIAGTRLALSFLKTF